VAAKQQHCAVTEQDLRELFGNGASTLTFAEAARQRHPWLLPQEPLAFDQADLGVTNGNRILGSQRQSA